MTPVSATLWDTLKIVPLVFVLALFQLSTAPGLMPYGSGPDLVLVVVVALALWRGSVMAAVTGFCGGLLLNAMVFVPAGHRVTAVRAHGRARGPRVAPR